jgi:hypothetical protein
MKKVHGASVANSLIWAAAIIGAAIMLRDTPQGGQVVVILGGAAGASVIVVGNALRKAAKESAKGADSGALVETRDG